MSEELKPCPDGHQTAKVANWPNSVGEWKFYAYCTCCGWRSGQAETEAEAITAWNRRAAAPDLHKALGEALEALEKSRARLVRIAGRDFNCSSHQHGMAAASHALIGVHEAEDAIASIQKALAQVEGGQ